MSPESPPFHLEFTHDGEAVVVSVCGEIDMVTAPALQVALTETIVQQGRLSVRIDLAQVTFMDSSGLRVLMVSFNELQERGGRLEITNPSPITMKLFEATGLTKVFTISFPAPSGPAEDGQTPTA